MMLKDILDTFQFNCSLVSDSVTPRTAACQNTLPITNTWTLLKLMSIESVMLSNYLNHCHPLLLLPSIFPSIRGFSNELALHKRWPKYWGFSFSISPSNEYSGLISFRTDWFDPYTSIFHKLVTAVVLLKSYRFLSADHFFRINRY